VVGCFPDTDHDFWCQNVHPLSVMLRFTAGRYRRRERKCRLHIACCQSDFYGLFQRFGCIIFYAPPRAYLNPLR
jgi:hypothetical protein